MMDVKVLDAAKADSILKKATFAGGCFWGLELAFQRAQGVVSTKVQGCCEHADLYFFVVFLTVIDDENRWNSVMDASRNHGNPPPTVASSVKCIGYM